MTALLFLDLPVELRLDIYEHFLAEHCRVRKKIQPNNGHLRLLRTCKQIEEEAGPILRRYLSLLHELQIQAALLRAPAPIFAQVQWADVGNDGRVFHKAAGTDQEDAPLSSLHAALARMTALSRLRVFECRQGLPINLQGTMSLHRSRRLELRFERAMFPQVSPRLSVYELYVNPEKRVELFDVLHPLGVVALRLSGEIVVPPGERRPMPALRHVTLHGITGNFFDRHTIEECFPGAQLDTFKYALGHRLGFELRNHHLQSLTTAYGARLRKLVLLGCSRLSSTTVTECLESLPSLEYFALHMVTVDELRSNFVLSLPPRLSVFKLQMINAWYAIALKAEERVLCDAIESTVLLRESPFNRVCLCFRTQLMDEGGRRERWSRIAHDRHVWLEMGPWEDQAADEL